MLHQKFGKFGTLRDRFGNHVSNHGLFDIVKLGLCNRFGKTSLSELHQRAVEGARHGERNGLDTSGTAVFDELVHASDRTGHHDLARAVDVCRNHGTSILHGFAKFKNLGFVLAHDSGHGTRVLGTGAGHEFATGTHQAKAFFEAETTGSINSGVFTEGVTSHIVKGKAFGLEQFHHHGRHSKESRLRVVGALQNIFGTFGHELGKRETENLISLLHELLGRFKSRSERLAHAHVLGTLAREKQNRLRHYIHTSADRPHFQSFAHNLENTEPVKRPPRRSLSKNQNVRFWKEFCKFEKNGNV